MVSYARELPFVDPERIVVAGHSGGGFDELFPAPMPEAFLAAFREGAAVVPTFVRLPPLGASSHNLLAANPVGLWDRAASAFLERVAATAPAPLR